MNTAAAPRICAVRRESGAARSLARLGEVGARPLKDPVLELPVFDIMATAFQPLPNPNPRGLEPAPGTEDADAPASPAAAPAVSTVSLNPRVWSEPLRVDILHRVVRWQLAKRRTTAYRGTTYSEKSGSGRKPFKQKGTGMARQGNKRAPLQRGGVKAHAPVLRQWAFKLNKRVRQLGMRVALSAKLAAGRVALVEGADRFTSAKTADLTRRIQAVAEAALQPDPATDCLPVADTEALLVVDPSEMTDQLELAGRAQHRVTLVPQLGCTVLDLLKRDALIITPRALEALQARLA
ncbi:hypothetical protein FNF31_05723 [Cafeteria roenbergensis]|uniref:Large ribosomal subunit protein uL4m n=1 Tax=Cafeteria roenbergensis TaxID=33653 RepID=A0A5A8CY21_CAFRO|nr:hypothetical protein FNF31_05723 [Cafeteria roenbergensis]